VSILRGDFEVSALGPNPNFLDQDFGGREPIMYAEKIAKDWRESRIQMCCDNARELSIE
jgi:hypothetical protein